jgi:UDP-glucose:glycoprotein glucosyltransferase
VPPPSADLESVQLGVLSNDKRKCGIEAVFGVDYIIVGGRTCQVAAAGCMEGSLFPSRGKKDMSSPPPSFQLPLAAHHRKPVSNTLIVENLGYLQLKAIPGVYHLEICFTRRLAD